MQKSEYKNNMQKLIDFCNLVKMQRILNNIHGNKKHNEQVSKVEQQDNSNLINLTKKSKIVSKILSKNKQSEIKVTKKSQSGQSQIKLLQINQGLSSQISKSNQKIGSNNQKIKKKSNKFEKCSKVEKTEKLISNNDNELKQYAYQTPNKQEDQLQDSQLSLKQLIRQEQILKDIGKISQSHLNSPNKSHQSHLYKQYYRSQSTSPKHIIRVKTPNTYGKQEYSTPIKQFSQFTQYNEKNKQKQIDIVKHRSHLLPTHKKEDIIQVMEGESNRKKENIMNQNHSPHQSTAKSNKNSKKSKVIKHSEIKKQSSLSLSKRGSNIKSKSTEKKVLDEDNVQNDDIILNLNIEIEQEHSGNIKVPATKPKITHQQAENNHSVEKSNLEKKKQEEKTEKAEKAEEFQQKQAKIKQKSKPKINIDKLYIKSIGNKYLETILSDYIQSQQ